MKKTLTVNLGGTVYNIDEDAYRLLDNYLNNLKIHFRKQQGADEIIDDIEARISELFSEKMAGGKQVITIADVEEIIVRLGKPEDFDDQEDEKNSETNTGKTSETKSSERDQSAQNKQQEQPHSSRTAHVKQRLYRDPDHKMLGGVAAGISAYLDWDVTLVRILMVFFVFIPYTPVIIAYLIAWIVIPEAQTAAEKLSMRGQAVTIENIGKTVTDGFEKVANNVNDYVNSEKPRTLLQKIADVIISVAAFLFKLFLAALVIVCCPVLFVLAIVFISLIVCAIGLAIGGGAFLFNLIPAIDWEPIITISPFLTIAGTMGGVLLVGIPLVGLVYTIFRQLFNWTPMGAGVKWSLFAFWLIGATFFFISLSAYGWHWPY